MPVSTVYQHPAIDDSTTDEDLENYFPAPSFRSFSSKSSSKRFCNYYKSRTIPDSVSSKSTSTILNNRFFALVEEEDRMLQELTTCNMIDEYLESSTIPEINTIPSSKSPKQVSAISKAKNSAKNKPAQCSRKIPRKVQRKKQLRSKQLATQKLPAATSTFSILTPAMSSHNDDFVASPLNVSS